MTNYILLPFIAAFCVWLIPMANIPWKFMLRFKPFICEICMAFWISLFYLLNLNASYFIAVILSGSTAYLTGVFKRLL